MTAAPLEITGYVAAHGYGLKMYLHEGGEDSFDARPVPIDSDRGRLWVHDTLHYDHDLAGKIGSALLAEDGALGYYEAIYDIDEDKLPKYGHRGIMSAAMEILLGKLCEYDTQLRGVQFNIRADNQKSIGLAVKLGAHQVSRDASGGVSYRLPVADYLSRRRQGVAHV